MPPLGCAACSAGGVCPGLLSTPLLNFSAAIGGDFSADGVWAACPPLLPRVARAAPTAESSSSQLTGALFLPLAVGGSLLFALLLSALFVALAPRHARRRLAPPAALPSLLRLLDLFSLNHKVAEGRPLVKRATPLGGIFSLMGLGSIAVYAGIMVNQWRSNNVLVLRSLDILDSRVWLQVAALPWASAATGGISSSEAGGWGAAPLALRLTVDGDLGACAAPLHAPTVTGLAAGAWSLASSARCGVSSVAQHTLLCHGCVFAPAASISLLFHYSCQSVLLEAAAAPPFPPGAALSVATAAPRDTVGLPNSPLKSLTWTLEPRE